MKTYEKYKDSGIEWIGEIPEHWEVSRLKFMGESIIGLTYSPEEVTEDESGYLVLRSSNIQNGKLSLNDNVFVKKQINEKLITRINDILICARNGSVDLVGKNILIDEKTEGQTFGAFMTIFRGKSNQFVYWFFNSPFFDAQKGAFSTSTINQLTSTILNNLITTVPPEIEQTAIANYLDSKTTKIDRIVANKEALVSLYEEEKKALINEAVTKGVALSGKLKSSGVDWLGDVPEHWEVKKLKYLLKDTKGALKPGPFGSDLKTSDYLAEGNYKVYTQRNVLDNDFEKGDDYISDEKFESLSVFEINPDEILVTTRGSIGKSAVFPTGSQKGIIHPCLIKLQIENSKVLNDWLIKYFNESSYFEENVHLESNSTIIDVIYGYTLNNIIIPTPPIDEQFKILQCIEIETANINDKINQIKQEIDLLKEYRQALIFEAVTGKVRVD